MPRFLGLGNGASGVLALGSFTQVNVTCSGTSGSTSLTATGSFSPGDRLFIHQSRGGANVGKYEDNRVASYSSGTITLVHPLENTYTDSGASQAQVVVVPEASSVTGSYTQPAWDGDKGGLTVIACSGTFSGTITATGKGFRGGSAVSGTVGGAGQSGKQGEGTVGAGDTTSQSANGNGGGGAVSAGDAGKGGGGGGHSAAGTNGGNGDGSGGVGGSLVGDATFSSLINLGGGGGSGAGESNDNLGPHQSGAGGRGGGIVVVYCSTMSGTIVADGTAGVQGGKSDDGSGSGGGGAGGSILLKGKNITITGSTSVKGSGGAAIAQAVNVGGNGADGRIRVESCSLSGTSNPSASSQVGGHSYCGGAIFIL